MVTEVNSSSSYQTTQSTTIQHSLSQRVGILLKRSGVEIKGEGPIELSLDDSGKVVVSGNVENLDELTDALAGDRRLKNLLEAKKLTSEQETEAEDTIAGVSKDQLAELWKTLENEPGGEAKLKQVVDRLQALDDLGAKYTGEVSAEAILSTDKGQDYYKNLASTLKANMPSIFDYMSSTGSSGTDFSSILGGGGSAGGINGLFASTNSYALSKAYSQQSQSGIAGVSGYASQINLDA